MNRPPVTPIVLLALLLLAGCNIDNGNPAGYGTQSYQYGGGYSGYGSGGGTGNGTQAALQILESRCTRCHNVQDLESQPSQVCSLVSSGQMPRGGPPLGQQEIGTLCSWAQNSGR